MNGKLVAATIVAGSFASAIPAYGELLKVQAIRNWTSAEATRVAIEVSGDFKYKTQRLHNPERIFFDIQDSKPRLEDRKNINTELSDRILKRIRVAETTPGVTRVVLDIQGPVESSVSQLGNPNRLVIELRAKGGAAPAPASSTLPKPPPAVIKESAAKAVAKAESKTTAEPSKAQTLPPPPVIPAPLPQAKPEEPDKEGKAARRTSKGDSSLTRALGLKVNRVVIDAGHGGHDQGSAGSKGLVEKELVLDIALRVGKLIETRLGAEVLYTRTSDIFVPLEGRTNFANENKADLFLSIHANSSPLTRISGAETYYLNFTDARDALDVAARENAASQKSVFELRDLIHKITLHEKIEESREFANRVQTSMHSFSAKSIPGNRNRGVKKAPFVVLIGASMPSILAEVGFVSNPREEALLKRPDHREKLADALFRGLSKYAESLSHFQMASTPAGGRQSK